MPLLSAQKKAGRRAFKRTNVPLSERIQGFAIVALLVAIAGAIWNKGQHFDPNSYSLRSDALDVTASEVKGKQGTLKSQSAGGLEDSGHSPEVSPSSASDNSSTASDYEEAAMPESSNAAVKPSSSVKNEPLEIAVAGIKSMGETEFYNAENLYEKINGRSPAYLAFGFQQLRTRSFAIEKTADSYVDVYEFRMDTPINAFGAFAMERDPNGTRIDFVGDGYSGALGYYFRKGPVYVQVIASDQNPNTLKFARLVAENRARMLPPDDKGLDGRRKLPASGLIPESVSFIQDNAQGQAFLKNVFQAAYRFEEKKLPFFLMVTTPAEAEKAWNAFREFCGKYGGKTTLLPEINGARLFKAENFGTWKIIYQRNGELGGVFEANEPEASQRFIEGYLKGEIH